MKPQAINCYVFEKHWQNILAEDVTHDKVFQRTQPAEKMAYSEL